MKKSGRNQLPSESGNFLLTWIHSLLLACRGFFSLWMDTVKDTEKMTTYDAVMIAEGVYEGDTDQLQEAWQILVDTCLAWSLTRLVRSRGYPPDRSRRHSALYAPS